MANTIKLKRASGSDPGNSDLSVGELAIRTSNCKLFSKNDGGSAVGVVAGSADTLTTARTIAGVSFDGSANISLNNNAITNGAGYLADIVSDTSPQLGGDLDVQSSKITTATSNGNVKIEPNGSGVVEVRGAGGNDGKLQLNCSAQSHGIKLASPAHSASQSYTLIFPDNQIAADKYLKIKSISGSGSTAIGQAEYASLDANDLGEGTVPDARFPSTLPALNGSALTNLNGSNIASGTVAAARVATLNQDTTGNAATATALATARTIAGVSFDGTSNISLNNNAITNGAGYITTVADTTIAPSTIDMEDDEKIKLGNSDDLQIYHDGTRNIVEGTGQLRLCGTTNVLLRASPFGDVGLNYIVDGAVELFHDNTKRFETTAGGVLITGSLGTTDTLTVGGGGHIKTGTDTGKFFSGASNDLQMYHDGSNSYLDNSTGDFFIRNDSNAIKIRPKNDEESIVAHENGAVELHYDNSKKFETTSIGTKTTGVLQVTDATDADTGNRISVGTSQDIRIYHVGGNDSYIRNYTGDFYLQGNNSGTIVNNIKFENSNGATELYYNGSKKFETTSSGVSVTGDVLPNANNSRDLGSSSYRWANLYINDMHFANSVDNPNKVDGTWGDWTLQEGEDTIYMLNNRNGKQYKMNLTEV